jgi:hypothetical protein
MLAAIELIQLREHVTVGKSPEDSQSRRIRSVPAPKKDQGIIGQPSTEFVRLALQMISPGITDSKVITAIKHGLQTQKEFYDLIPGNAGLAKTLGAIFRMDERAILVPKFGPKRGT